MTARWGWPAACVAASITLLGPARPRAAGINTDVALPVRQGGFVYRTQLRYVRAGDDPTPLDRDVDTYIMPHVLVYGAAPRTTLFGILPFIAQSVDLPGGPDKTVEGMGDLTFLVRQTVLARDAVQRTSRLALLAGLEVASGKEAFSTHGTDFILGGVYTLQSGRHELDADLVAKINTEARGVDPGEELQYDLAYQLRVAPWHWPEQGTPSQVFAVIEVNGLSSERAVAGPTELPDTGGTLVFLAPGVQWVARRWIWEVSVQIPVVENLNGDQLEPDVIIASGIRVQF